MEDIYVWATHQATLLRQHDWKALDINGIAEELEDMGKKERRSLVSHLTVRLEHLLKWEYQSSHRSHSWRRSLLTSITEIRAILEDSPSLRPYLSRAIAEAYSNAVPLAALGMGTSAKSLPKGCPYKVDKILDPDFLMDDVG